MARTNNLTNFLTDVASAIKTKTGDSTAIQASQFDTKIAGITTGKLTNEEYNIADDDLDDILENTVIPSGTISITENGNYDVTNYIGANVNVVSEYNTKMNTTFINSSTIIGNITEIPLINLGNNISLVGFLNGFIALKTIPLIDTSNVINMMMMFQSCSSLISIPQLDTSNVTNMYSIFGGCSSLTTVPILNTSKVSNMQSMFSNCSNLSNDSLNNIMQMCINATSYTGTKTLKHIGLSSTQATTCQSLSNYQAFLDAGWTTGY